MIVFEAIDAAFKGAVCIRVDTGLEMFAASLPASEVKFLYARYSGSAELPHTFILSSAMLDNNWTIKESK